MLSIDWRASLPFFEKTLPELRNTMSCCGRVRAVVAEIPDVETAGLRIQPRRSSDVVFEYVGRTSLTVRGPVTGAIYRFQRKGSRVSVRARDSVALAAVPNLRRVHISS